MKRKYVKKKLAAAAIISHKQEKVSAQYLKKHLKNTLHNISSLRLNMEQLKII